MNSKIIFTRTIKGESEAMRLSENHKRVLLMVDGKATLGEMSKRAAPSMRSILEEVIAELEQGGFIRDANKPGHIPKMVTPQKSAIPPAKPAEDELDVLDFTVKPVESDTLVAEAAKLKMAAEAKAREKAESMLLMPAPEMVANQTSGGDAKAKPADADGKTSGEFAKVRQGPSPRSTSATVLFFDVVGYTKQSVNKQNEIKLQFNNLVTDCLDAQENGERIILDTGDGAAIGFLQHPEDALEVAILFRKTVTANQHKDFPELNVRIGIHLGPINVVKDMNGQNNMVGDGINDAQRVMSFAGVDQVFISRPYYDFVSRLNDEYANMFQYRGIKKDKHGRDHQVYELVDAAAPAAATLESQTIKPATLVKLEPFSLAIPDTSSTTAPATAEKTETPSNDGGVISGLDKFILAEAQTLAEIPPSPQESKPAAASESSAALVSQPVSIPQESPPALSLPSYAAERSTVQPDKPVEKSVLPSVDEVSKFAEIQARAWADAKKRSAEALKASTETAPRLEAPQPKKKEVSAVRRKPLPWGMIIAGSCILLLIALLVVPPFLPMKGYITSVEQMLATRFQQPVHVGNIAVRLLPAPRLELQDVSVGAVKSLQMQQVKVDFAWLEIITSHIPAVGIELDGIQVKGADLPAASTWLQSIAADARYSVTHIGLGNGKLEADGMQFVDIGGDISFDKTGKFVHAKLHDKGSKIAVEIDSTSENKTQISIAVRDSALPLLPDWVFDELYANGELGGESLVVKEFGGRIKGGELHGNGVFDWHSGWHAQGTMTARNVTLQNIYAALSGDMDTEMRFQMQSASLSRLAEAAALEGVFVIRKGAIQGIDIIAAGRQRSMESVAGGRTYFDETSGELNYLNGSYRLRQVKMSSGVLNATGILDISKQQLSGRITADLTKFAGMGVVVLQVGGTTDMPTLRAVR